MHVITRKRLNEFADTHPKAAQRLVVLTDELSSAYEDLETLALKVSFSAEQKVVAKLILRSAQIPDK